MGSVIGLVGLSFSGKKTIATHLERVHGFQVLQREDRIRAHAARIGVLASNEDMLHQLDVIRASRKGVAWIAEELRDSILEAWQQDPSASFVILEVRSSEDVAVYRELDGFKLVRIESPRYLRYNRWCETKGVSPDAIARQGFQRVESASLNVRVSSLMRTAEHAILNNGHVTHVYRALEEILRA